MTGRRSSWRSACARVGLTVATALVACALPSVGAASEGDSGEAPRASELIERAGAALIQLDVSLEGPAESIEDLTADDFRVVIGGREIADPIVDRACLEIESTPDDGAADEATPDRPAPTVPPTMATYAFYIDQPLLTIEGLQGAFSNLRDLIPRLFAGGRAQGMLFYRGRELTVVQDMTTDPDLLLAGIERLDGERRNWDFWSMTEVERLERVADLLEDFGERQAISEARRHQREEIFQMQRSLGDLSLVLGRFSEQPSPKAFVYFADTLRRNAGGHYMAFFSGTTERPSGPGSESIIASDAEGARLHFDRLIEEADAVGVRFYAVQGQGLTTEGPSLSSSRSLPRVRERDAKDALAAMALETGGLAFLNGVAPKKMAAAILEDVTCMYLVSVPVEGFPLDKPLPVRIEVRRPKVRARTRTSVVVASESTRQTRELLGAFATSSLDPGSPVRGRLIPVGFDDGKYVALVQVSVPGTEVGGATWDLGASAVARGTVRSDTSARVTPTAPGTRVILEAEMTFPPGPYDLVTVARETITGQVFRNRLSDEWPIARGDDVAVVVGVSIVQPDRGAFVREGEVRTTGAVALGEGDPIDTSRPTALVGLVCRAKGLRGPLVVERELQGDNAVPFPPVEIADDERCSQLRDLVPAGSLTSGAIEYRVRVLRNGRKVAEESTKLIAIAPDFDPSRDPS